MRNIPKATTSGERQAVTGGKQKTRRNRPGFCQDSRSIAG
jgi:hypothetical protein